MRNLLLLSVIAWGGGCATISPMVRHWPGIQEIASESGKNPVIKVLSIWQPAEGVGIDGRTSRGFSGQVMFFTAEKQAISKVGGSVEIYVFDDQGPAEEQSKPIHIWEFKPEVWKALMAKSHLGPTYQVFIPYTRKGAHAANCALRVKYIPAQGTVISSEMINVALEGIKKPIVNAAKLEDKSSPRGEEGEELEEDEGVEVEEEGDEVVPDSPRTARKRSPIELDERERQRILKEFGENRPVEASPKTAMRPEESVSGEGSRVGHLLEDDDEDSAAIPPAERLGLRPVSPSHLADWEDGSGILAENSEGEGIRQAAWESSEEKEADQEERKRAPRKKASSKPKKRTVAKPGERHSMQVHSIPLN